MVMAVHVPRARAVAEACRALLATSRGRGFSSSVNADEVARFAAASGKWWDEFGEYAMLHEMNPTRVRFMVDQLSHTSGPPHDTRTPLRGTRWLDVGSGGGLLAEALSRLGASVLGIDATAENVGIAQAHASKDTSLFIEQTPEYRHTTAEDLAASGATFDVVSALEVLEHVEGPTEFVRTCISLVKPGGSLFLSTVNRTPLAYALTIGAAEQLLRWVPQGTHTYSKFVTPDEVHAMIDAAGDGAKIRAMSGLIYDPLLRQWHLHPSRLTVNYIVHVVKGHDSLSSTTARLAPPGDVGVSPV